MEGVIRNRVLEVYKRVCKKKEERKEGGQLGGSRVMGIRYSRFTVILTYIRLRRGSRICISSNDLLHLHARLSFHVSGCQILALLGGKALVALLVLFLELKIGRRTGPHKHCDPVSQYTALRKWSQTVRFGKFMRIEVFTSGFTTAHEPKMIEPQSRGIRRSKTAIYDHRKRNSPMVDRFAKRNVLAVLEEKYMR